MCSQIVGRQQADNNASDQHQLGGFQGNEWRLYLVMEYMDGSSLKEVIRTQALMLHGGMPDMVSGPEAWLTTDGILHVQPLSSHID